MRSGDTRERLGTPRTSRHHCCCLGALSIKQSQGRLNKTHYRDLKLESVAITWRNPRSLLGRSLKSITDRQGQRQGHYNTSRQSETLTVKQEENTIHLLHSATYQVTTRRRRFRLQGCEVINSYTTLDLSRIIKEVGSPTPGTLFFFFF